MVTAIINIDERTNRVLNVVKARFGLKDKSQAIEVMAEQYEQEVMEPELRPEYIRKAKRIMKQKPIRIGTVNDFRARYGLK
jgi:hypothetical protein